MAQQSGAGGGQWKTGAMIVLGAVIPGVVVGYLLRSVASPYGLLAGFIAGAALGFLIISYLMYGR